MCIHSMNGFRFFFQTWARNPNASGTVWLKLFIKFKHSNWIQLPNWTVNGILWFTFWALTLRKFFKFPEIPFNFIGLMNCTNSDADSRISIFCLFYFNFALYNINYICSAQWGPMYQSKCQKCASHKWYGHCWPMFCTALGAAMFHLEYI